MGSATFPVERIHRVAAASCLTWCARRPCCSGLRYELRCMPRLCAFAGKVPVLLCCPFLVCAVAACRGCDWPPWG